MGQVSRAGLAGGSSSISKSRRGASRSEVGVAAVTHRSVRTRCLVAWVRGLDLSQVMFSRLVPNLREIGLLTRRTTNVGLRYFDVDAADKLTGEQLLHDLDLKWCRVAARSGTTPWLCACDGRIVGRA